MYNIYIYILYKLYTVNFYSDCPGNPSSIYPIPRPNRSRPSYHKPRLEPLKHSPQPGSTEQALEARDYSTQGVTICWLQEGSYYQRVGIKSPLHSAGGSNYPVLRTTLRTPRVSNRSGNSIPSITKIGDSAGIALQIRASHYKSLAGHYTYNSM